MATSASSGNDLLTCCKICGARSALFGETELLGKYRVKYFRCDQCGFIQTEEPYWLGEAYSSAIAKQDVGVMQRNLVNCELTLAVLNLLFPEVSTAIDFGAAHGVLVRMMRDRGFNFAWYDHYATNDYARGFEHREGFNYDFLTAFEVLEHLVDPVSDLSNMMSLSENVFVSTFIVPQPVPGLNDWWYYTPSSGQHIALYTLESLRLLAVRFERSLLSVGPYHLFTKKPRSSAFFRLAMNFRIAKIVNRIHRRPGLIESDFQQMTR